MALQERVRVALGTLVAALGTACVIDAPKDIVPQACDVLTCSANGHCTGGECHCDRGFVGNPNALHGCQPLGTDSPCGTTCGLNAFCEDSECRCDDGFVAVCATGDCISVDRLCDGTTDCVNAADEDPMVCYDGDVQVWSIVDECNDGQDIEWRVWSQDREWVWPDIDHVFTASGLGVESLESIECLTDELLCFGGESGDRQWGIGLDGAGSCDDCCQPCAPDTVEIGALTCD